MGLGCVPQGMGLVDFDLDGALGHHVEQGIGRFQQIGAGGGVVNERGPGKEQRALGGQNGRLESGYRAGGIPKLTNMPRGARLSREPWKVSLPTLS